MEGLVLSENRVFLVTDDLGDVTLGNTRGLGLYYLDTRFLSALELEINGQRPELLSSSAEHNYLGNIQLTNPAFRLPDGQTVAPQTISIRRNRFIESDSPSAVSELAGSGRSVGPVAAFAERIGLFNYNHVPVPVEVVLTFAADFRDVFDVRGYHRGERGQVLDPTCDGQLLSRASFSDTIRLHYLGRDSLRRRTDLLFEQPPVERELIPGGQVQIVPAVLRLPELAPGGAPGLETLPPGVRVRYRLVLEPQRPYSLTYYVLPSVESTGVPDATARVGTQPRARFDIAAAEIRRSYEEQWLADCTRVSTGNEVFNQMLFRGQVDVRALLARYPTGPLPYAGVPWYSAPFGRDALITSDQVLLLNPEVALGTLRFLAAHQGRAVNDWRDEEPGKILHEIRYGEFAGRGRVPHSPYYGSVDATPLFVILFCKTADWLGDDPRLTELWPAVERAVEWIDRYGDRDGDGFVEYATRSPEGLRNQAWKDSGDSYRFPDGTLAEPPIASVEVQGYVYDARVRLARLLRRRGQAERADQLEAAAERLQRAIDERFWMPDEGYYAQALDHRKVQVPAVTSNPGHLLWSGALYPERAALVARRLLAEDMFSGWGIRTLSSMSPDFNPMSYHNGSVWPHDNSLIAAGLRRYGHDELANQVVEAIFQAGLHFRYFRLPELFCGFTRDQRYRATPAEYPVSCSPQSWAAGSVVLFLSTVLGLAPDAAAGRVGLRPRLPEWLGQVVVRSLRVGDGRLSFVASAAGTRVLDVEGKLDVELA